MGKLIQNTNELMVCFGRSGYVYFETSCDDGYEAVEEFYTAMENAGISCDNLEAESWLLRDAHGEIIDEG